jgi:hypothetical protein
MSSRARWLPSLCRLKSAQAAGWLPAPAASLSNPNPLFHVLVDAGAADIKEGEVPLGFEVAAGGGLLIPPRGVAAGKEVIWRVETANRRFYLRQLSNSIVN